MLDAPVSGGDSGAKATSLSIMTGGDEEVFEQMRPLFSLLGTGIQYMGEAGSGQHTKACNQIAVAGAVASAIKNNLWYMQERSDWMSRRCLPLSPKELQAAGKSTIPHRVLGKRFFSFLLYQAFY